LSGVVLRLYCLCLRRLAKLRPPLWMGAVGGRILLDEPRQVVVHRHAQLNRSALRGVLRRYRDPAADNCPKALRRPPALPLIHANDHVVFSQPKRLDSPKGRDIFWPSGRGRTLPCGDARITRPRTFSSDLHALRDTSGG